MKCVYARNKGNIMNRIRNKSVWNGTQKLALAFLLAGQFTIAYYFGTRELLTNTGFAIIPPIAVTVLTPVVVFLMAYALSVRFRSFVFAQDVRTLTALQLWRVVGFTFLALYSFEVLPGLFVWPAGLGDVAVGLGAAFVVTKLDRNPDYVRSRGFIRFQFLGLLDFVIALGTAALSSGTFPGLITNGLTSAALDVWPLNLFPSFIVPGFIILHLATLLKVRHARQQGLSGAASALAT